MNTTSPATTLTRFRQQLYRCFGMRRDALFALLDAILSPLPVESLVGLSLVPGFARGWASTCDALSDGSLDVPALQRVLVSHLAAVPPAGDGRELWALDGSSWPRPTAPTSPERTACRVLVPGSAGHTMADGWEYQWLVAVPEDAGSWVLPLAVERRRPTAGTPTTLAITQVGAVQAARAAARAAAGLPPAAGPRPLLLLDSHYAVGQLVAADLGVDLLARLAANRVFRRPAPSWQGIGRVPKHGAPFKVADPTTHGAPDVTTIIADPTHGPITCARWDRLHDARQAGVELSVIRIQHARYAPQAHRTGTPQPLWLVWCGAGAPPSPERCRQWYQRRFAIEHAFRFLKQTLGWTTPQVRSPQAADRWSWLVALALWLLWLAREAVVPASRPWERRLPTPPPAGDTPLTDTPMAEFSVAAPPVRRPRPTPGQVRRAFASLLPTLGTPVRPPRRRGKAPGRQPGDCPGRAQRFPAVKRGPPVRATGSRAPP